MIWVGLVVFHSRAFAWPRLFPSAGAAASAGDAADDEDEVSVRLRPVVVHNVSSAHTHRGGGGGIWSGYSKNSFTRALLLLSFFFFSSFTHFFFL